MKRLVLIALLACASQLFAYQKKQAPSDDQILDQVRMRLTTDIDVKGGNDEVTVNDGVVTIKGRVATEKGKNKATKLAKKVKGVKSVDNQLVVGPPTT
jgi:hyperosmotically inducible protein